MENEMSESKISPVTKAMTFIKKVNFFQILMLLVLVVLGYFAYVYRGEFVVATVNGKPITRYQLMTELEKQGATQALDSIIIQKLITTKAQEKKIEVSNEIVATEIKTIKETLKAQGMELDQALQAQGMTMESFIGSRSDQAGPGSRSPSTTRAATSCTFLRRFIASVCRKRHASCSLRP